MISSHFGHIFDKPLASIARNINLPPNVITFAGFLVTIVAAFVIPHHLTIGGILILIGGFFDIFDGISARVNNRTTEFGAFLDSVLDRYSDSFLFLGFAWYFKLQDSTTGIIITMGTLIGALIISYARARAEGLGKECHTGLMERPERVILMAFGAITGWIFYVMWIMLILTHITVIQRIHHAWKVMK